MAEMTFDADARRLTDLAKLIMNISKIVKTMERLVPGGPTSCDNAPIDANGHFGD